VTSPRAVIFRRHLARLRSNRSVIIGLVFGVLIMALLIGGSFIAATQSHDPDRSLVFQYMLWKNGELFSFLVVVFAIVLGSSLANDDIKSGTIFGVLARPVSRADYFVGSLAGAAVFVVVLQLLRIVSSLVLSIVFDGKLTLALFLGFVVVILGDLLYLSMFAAIGAVTSNAVAVFLGLLAVLITGLAFVPDFPAWVTYPLRAIAIFLPIMNESADAAYKAIVGESRLIAPVLEAIAYRSCWIAVLCILGVWGFSRREIAPRT